MSSAVSVTPIEQKVAAIDSKVAEHQLSANKAYVFKFACASLSSRSATACRAYLRSLLDSSGMAASGVTNPFDMCVVLVFQEALTYKSLH